MRRLFAALVAAVVLGLLVAGAALGQVAWSSWQTDRHQAVLLGQVAALPASHTVPARRRSVPVAFAARVGRPFATLRIPRFGADWRWAVLEGVAADVLADGPGHYPGTPLPGARGNVAIAAHRAGHGSPFLDFDRLRVGDPVEIGQGGVTWVYRITRAPEIIPASDTAVLDPLPGRRLTLTTCWPKYGSSKRMFVRATLARVQR